MLARGQQRAARLAERVAVAEDELAAARRRLRREQGVLSDRLVAIYKSGTPDATTVLLEADGFEDLAARTELLDRVREADENLVTRVRELREQVAVELAGIEQAEQQAIAFNQQVSDAREQIASVRAGAEAEATALAAARERQQAAVSELQSQVGAWTAEVERLEQVSAEEAEQTVAEWTGGGGGGGGDGDWVIPEGIVMCESGGNFDAVNPSSGAGGAYQILPSTWELYGGSGNPQDASPAQQHEIASQIWADSGGSAWVC